MIQPISSTSYSSASGDASALSALLHEVTSAFADARVGEASRIMEQTLELEVSWELLTQAVRRGVEAGTPGRAGLEPRAGS